MCQNYKSLKNSTIVKLLSQNKPGKNSKFPFTCYECVFYLSPNICTKNLVVGSVLRSIIKDFDLKIKTSPPLYLNHALPNCVEYLYLLKKLYIKYVLNNQEKKSE